MSNRLLAQRIMDQSKGILRFAPNWIPRTFTRPGRRLKLHPDDIYILGLDRGGICERWFASTIPVDNGPDTPETEGYSYVIADEEGKERIQFKELVEEFKGEVIGHKLYEQYGRWPIFAKFYDNVGPLPHHIHHNDDMAALVGLRGKPEMYFFPMQMNNYGGEFPFTFFGLNPGTSKDQLKECLKNFSKGDNKILDLARAYKLVLDTGFDVPPGVLHAPGSLCTYEPQMASDVLAMCQSVLLGDHLVSEKLMWQNVPEDKQDDVDFLISLIDWDVNVDPLFFENRHMAPKPAEDPDKMIKKGYLNENICYKSKLAGADRLTVLPGKTVTVKDPHSYGFILIQGYGEIEGRSLECPIMIRYGQDTYDEYFVTCSAAERGVTIKNNSKVEPLVLLKHFAKTF